VTIHDTMLLGTRRTTIVRFYRYSLTFSIWRGSCVDLKETY